MRKFYVNPIILVILFFFSFYIHVSIIKNVINDSNSRIHQDFTINNRLQIQGDYDDIFGDIIVISPNEGDKFNIGDIITIEWEYSGGIKYVTIALYRSGNYMDTIALATINDGEFEWNVGNYNEGSDYKIGIWDYNDFNVSDFSYYFTIKSTQENRFKITYFIFLTSIIILGLISISVTFYLVKNRR
jgi:hypothetical protein